MAVLAAYAPPAGMAPAGPGSDRRHAGLPGPRIWKGPMKVVIFAGGYGTRISEETVALPKPLVEIS